MALPYWSEDIFSRNLWSLEFYEVLLSLLVYIHHSHLVMRKRTGSIPTAKAGFPDLSLFAPNGAVHLLFYTLSVRRQLWQLVQQFPTWQLTHSAWDSGQRGQEECSGSQTVWALSPISTVDESFNFWALISFSTQTYRLNLEAPSSSICFLNYEAST